VSTAESVDAILLVIVGLCMIGEMGLFLLRIVAPEGPFF
jgi:hypothetical protein